MWLRFLFWDFDENHRNKLFLIQGLCLSWFRDIFRKVEDTSDDIAKIKQLRIHQINNVLQKMKRFKVIKYWYLNKLYFIKNIFFFFLKKKLFEFYLDF